MSYLPLIALALAVLGLLMSLVALSMASDRFTNLKLTRAISQSRGELLVLADEVDGLRGMIKRQIARENMRKARDKSNGEIPSSDDDFLKSVSKNLMR